MQEYNNLRINNKPVTRSIQNSKLLGLLPPNTRKRNRTIEIKEKEKNNELNSPVNKIVRTSKINNSYIDLEGRLEEILEEEGINTQLDKITDVQSKNTIENQNSVVNVNINSESIYSQVDMAQVSKEQYEQALVEIQRKQTEVDNLIRKLQALNDAKTKAEKAAIDANNTTAQVQQLFNEQARINIEQVNAGNRTSESITHNQNTNIEIKIPELSEKTNPKKYLEEVKHYMKVKGIRSERRLFFIESIITNEVRDWFDTYKDNIETWEQFEKAFLKQFYAVAIQVACRVSWMAQKYNSDGTLLGYFYKQTREAKYLEPQMSEYEKNLLIIQQLPAHAKLALASVKLSDRDSVIETLTQLDVSKSTFGSVGNRQINEIAESYQINAFGYETKQTYEPRQQNDSWRKNRNVRNTQEYNRNTEWRSRNNVNLPDTSQPPPNRDYARNRQINQIQVDKSPPNNTLSQNFVDFVDELREEMIDNQKFGGLKQVKARVPPLITIEIGGQKIKGLLDSGSQITAISEKYFGQLLKNQMIEVLPVTSLHIKLALTGKSYPLRKQALITMKIQDLIIVTPMLIVKDLNQDILLGNDWFWENRVDYNCKKGTMSIGETEIDNSLLSFERVSSNKITCIDLTEKQNESVEINSLYDHISVVINTIDIKEKQDTNISPLEKEMIITLDDKINDIHQVHEICENQNTAVNLLEDSSSIADILTTVSENQQSRLKSIIETNKKIFSDRPGCSNSYQHKITLLPNRPIVKKSYPVPFAIRNVVDLEIKSMLQAGVIERSISQYCSPMRIVQKKDGSVRICLDARFINDIIEGDNESPPPINELMQRFNNTQIFSTFDLTAGYWQIPLSIESRQYTAFKNGSTTYQYCRCPFGLKTSGCGFIRGLSIALGNKCDSFLTYYVDDLVVASKDIDAHLDHLQILFEQLDKHGFTLKLSKARFCKKVVSFLGYYLSSEGFQPNPDKLIEIKNFENPKNKTELQSFLGICNYYQQFSVNHAYFIDPLRDLLKKDALWRWEEKHCKAFQELKNNFIKINQLHHYDLSREFYLQTDASDRGISCILYQINDQGEHKLISIISRCLQAAEINYTTTEKELLAVVYAVTKLRVFLWGRKFTIITDHQALIFLKKSPFHSARLSRWNLTLQEYDFEIKHCRGIDNIVADFFSRNPEGKFYIQNKTSFLVSSMVLCGSDPSYKQESEALVNINFLGMSNEYKRLIKNISRMQQDDRRLIQYIETRGKYMKKGEFKCYQGIWFHRAETTSNWRIVLPKEVQEKVITEEHERIGHGGIYKTLCQIKRNFWFKKLEPLTKAIITRCDLCQRVKHLNRAVEGEYGFVGSKEPGDLITVDFYGPLPKSTGGVQYIFVILDAFSKLVKLYPIKRANTRTVLNKILIEYPRDVGKPKRVLADNGTQFTAHAWKEQLESAGLIVKFCSIRHPQSNPTERVMRELGRMFRTFTATNHIGWAKHIKQIEKFLNYTTHCSTGYIPMELHFGKPVQDDIRKLIAGPDNKIIPHRIMIINAKEKLRRGFEQRRSKQKGRPPQDLKVNDLVLLRVPHISSNSDRTTHKFFHLYNGPYVIKKVIGSNAFVLTDPDTSKDLNGTYNRTSLRKYCQ